MDSWRGGVRSGQHQSTGGGHAYSSLSQAALLDFWPPHWVDRKFNAFYWLQPILSADFQCSLLPT